MAGTVSQKLVPMPGSLSTPIVPPIAFDQALCDSEANPRAAMSRRVGIIFFRERLEDGGEQMTGECRGPSRKWCSEPSARRLRLMSRPA
jgi:hypothetical protein